MPCGGGLPPGLIAGAAEGPPVPPAPFAGLGKPPLGGEGALFSGAPTAFISFDSSTWSAATVFQQFNTALP